MIFVFSYKADGKSVEERVWIKPVPIPFKEFKAHISALGFPHVSYAQYQLKLARKQAQAFQLKEKLMSAQEFYLSGEETKALKAFQNISQKALQADWAEEERRVLLYAFLRQAQMEAKTEKRTALLLSALEFSLFKINSLDYSDYDLFPPPLLKEIQLIQEKTNSLLIDWNKIFPKHEILLINGQRMEKGKKLKIPQGFYRISAFSSSHRPWSQKQRLSEMLTGKIETTSLTTGWCEKTKIKPENIKTNIKLLPFSNCISKGSLSFKKNKPTKKTEQSLSAKTLSEQEEKLESSSELLNSLELEEDQKSKEKKSGLSDLPPWLITGAGVLALVLILSFSQDRETETGEFVY